jgi:uncharacterized peroxidase-related enzyme
MSDGPTFLGEPPATPAAEAAYEEQRGSDGYVWNLTRLWCWHPEFFADFTGLRLGLMESSTLTDRDWAVLVTATAAARNDSYCSYAWGAKLAKLSDADTAAQVLADVAAPALSEREAALAAWARKVVADSNSTTTGDVASLREVGLSEREIFDATSFVALRLAFSTINGALGAAPDRQLADAAPEPVRSAVRYGRPAGTQSSRAV